MHIVTLGMQSPGRTQEPTSMKRNLAVLTMFAGLTLALSSGCATKNHVRSQVSPVVDKVNELDDLTASIVERTEYGDRRKRARRDSNPQPSDP